MPPDALEMVPLKGVRKGKVWVEHWRDGIVIMGRLEGDRPENWARFPGETKTRAHVSLWLALADGVKMPVIGWGSQFGYKSCVTYNRESALSMYEDCATWSRRQQAYRSELKKLFVRQWRLSPLASEEVFATDAYRKALAYANSFEREGFKKLEPLGTPCLQKEDTFEIYVRWSDFPPAASLRISRIYLAVEFFDGAGGHSSTAPARKAGEPASFNRLEFEQPPVFRVSSCGSPLQGADEYDKMLPAWYFPTDGGEVQDVFILANDAAGYRYGPEGLSPVPQWTHHFSTELGDGNRVCGPLLTLVAGAETVKSDQRIEESPLSALKLDDASYLLKWGPRLGTRSRFGSGYEGAAMTVFVDVFHVDLQKGVTPALSVRLIADDWQVADGDVQFSPDWRTVTVYKGGRQQNRDDLVWSSQQYCFSETKYEEREEATPSGPAPTPRQVEFPKLSQ